MPDLATLYDIHRRLREATGPDRELDAAIFDAFGLVNEEHARAWCRMDGRTDLTRAHYLSAWAHHFTNAEDIGKVIALIERALPRWKWMARTCSGGPTASVHHEKEGSPNVWLFTKVERAATVPLALCLALVSALIAIEEGKERGDG